LSKIQKQTSINLTQPQKYHRKKFIISFLKWTYSLRTKNQLVAGKKPQGL